MTKKKILIVDDVASNIHLLSTMLKDDYSIIAAKSGIKAIELASKSPQPDIILLDIKMPDMDGYEVCKRLKDEITTKNIPIIFISSLTEINGQANALIHGADDYLVKPVTRDILFNKIQTQIKLALYNKSIASVCKNDVQKENIMPKILIVDDAPQNIQVAVEILKDKYTVIVANCGEKALSMLEDDLLPDIILLDVIMPGIDGFEVCRKIKSNLNNCNIPIIFLTILENEHDMIKGLELGAVDYVTKPFEPKVLKARVDTHVRLKIYNDELINNIKEKDDVLIKQSKLATIGEMFENITHQWKQPLSIISMSSSTIRLEQELGTLNNSSINKLLDSIENSVNYLSNTVDDFNDFLIRDTPCEYFKIKQVLDNSLKVLASKIKNEKIDVVIEIRENKELYNYKNDLIQVLMNIFTNAMDSFKDKVQEKLITIDSEVLENEYVLKISDNGCGISPDIISKIFDKYFSTKMDEKSSGLGLYMCKKIVEDNLKGKLDVSSTREGTTFFILLPL